MRMDRRKEKQLSSMVKKMVNGFIGMRMDRRGKKELTRMGNRLERPKIINPTQRDRMK
jgi:hypothetical protein